MVRGTKRKDMNNEWISTTRLLPEIQTRVFVWIGGLINQPVKHYYTSKGKWVNMEKIVLPKYYEVDFWMPLPEPPKQL